MLILFPDTRFAYVDKSLESVEGGQNNLEEMVDNDLDTDDVPYWNTTNGGCKREQVQRFEELVKDGQF